MSEKINGAIEVVSSETEKSTIRYDRNELAMPVSYSGNIQIDIGTATTPNIIAPSFEMVRESGKMNLNISNFEDESILTEMINRIGAVKTAIQEEEVDIQSKIANLQAFYDSQATV